MYYHGHIVLASIIVHKMNKRLKVTVSGKRGHSAQKFKLTRR